VKRKEKCHYWKVKFKIIRKAKRKREAKKNSVWTRDELEILKNGLASKDTASQIQKSLGSRSKNEVELKFSDFMQKPDFADLISKEQKEFDKKQVKKRQKTWTSKELAMLEDAIAKKTNVKDIKKMLTPSRSGKEVESKLIVYQRAGRFALNQGDILSYKKRPKSEIWSDDRNDEMTTEEILMQQSTIKQMNQLGQMANMNQIPHHSQMGQMNQMAQMGQIQMTGQIPQMGQMPNIPMSQLGQIPQMHAQMNNQLHAHNQMNNQMNNQLNNQMNNQMNTQMNNQMNNNQMENPNKKQKTDQQQQADQQWVGSTLFS